MKRILLFVCVLGLVIYGLSKYDSPARAQGARYELSQFVSGAGGTLSGGHYEMSVAVGDPVADEATGGAYSLGGGVLGGSVRDVAPVTPTPTPTAMQTATPTETLTPSQTPPPTPTVTETPAATATATATPTATPTTFDVATLTPTATPTATSPAGGNGEGQIYLPLVGNE